VHAPGRDRRVGKGRGPPLTLGQKLSTLSGAAAVILGDMGPRLLWLLSRWGLVHARTPEKVNLTAWTPPDTRVAREAERYLQEVSSKPMVYHSVRTYYFSGILYQLSGVKQSIAVQMKFRPDIRVHRYDEDTKAPTVVLEDPVANKFFRSSIYEYDFLKEMDGRLTPAQIREKLRPGGRYYSEEYIQKLLDRTAQMGLLLFPGSTSSQTQSRFKEFMEKAKQDRALFKLFFIYIPIFNPDRFLEKTLWLRKLPANKYTACVAALFIPGALYLLIAGSSRIYHEFYYFFSFENMLWLWAALAVVKAVHEFSHAYTTKFCGLHVPEMGVALLIFFLRPYCNTTAAWQHDADHTACGALGIHSP
jgi:hypothetical protein